MRALNVLLALLVSLAIGFAVLELGLRLFPEFRPQASLNRFDPALGWSKRPDTSVRRTTREFAITITTNEDGLRDDAGTLGPKRAGTHRVVVLGDSFALGYTVERRDLFADLLEGWWRAEGRPIEIVNAGTEGWSTDQEAAWYLAHAERLDADLVLLFPYENDLYWNGQPAYNRFSKPRFTPAGELEARELVDPGRGPALLRSSIGNFLVKTLVPLLPRKPGPHQFVPAGGERPIAREFAPLLLAQPEFLGECLERTRGALLALQRRCTQDGARLVVAPIPSESAIHPGARAAFRERGLAGLDEELWSPDRPVELFLGLAQELGIETLDARAALRAEAEADPAAPLYFDAEWHFNPHGNRAFARFLHAELDARAILPAELGAQRVAELTPEPDPARARWPFVFAGLWVALSALYLGSNPDDRNWKAPLKVAGMLAAVFTLVLGGGKLLGLLPPGTRSWVLVGALATILGFVVWKLGRRMQTIVELHNAFIRRGHWYLMPLLVVLLSIGSLLVVAASSPLVAPFIYTLF